MWWGEERLLETLRQCRESDVVGIMDAVFAGADAFTRDAMQYDDMTLVVMKVR